MADNVTLNAMTGGTVVAADDIASVYYQRFKLTLGADGVNNGDVSSSNPIPANIAQVGGSAITLGQKTGANSVPVVLSSDTALPAGTNAIGKLAANSGVDIGDVDVTSVVPGTGATSLGKAEDAVHASGDTGIMALAVANVAQTSFAVDGDYVPMAVDLKGNTMNVGNIAHDGVDAGNPIKIGMRAVAHGSNPTAVAAADRTDWLANRHGIPFVMPGHPNIVTLRANYTAAQTDTALVTVGAGTKIVVIKASVMADNANTVDVQARIGFGTANTPTTTGVVLSHPGIARGSGVVEGNGSGIIGIGADNEDLRITSEVPTGGSIDVVVVYYTIES